MWVMKAWLSGIDLLFVSPELQTQDSATFRFYIPSAALGQIINLVDKTLLKKFLQELWLLYFDQNPFQINILRPMMDIRILSPIFYGPKNHNTITLP